MTFEEHNLKVERVCSATLTAIFFGGPAVAVILATTWANWAHAQDVLNGGHSARLLLLALGYALGIAVVTVFLTVPVHDSHIERYFDMPKAKKLAGFGAWVALVLVAGAVLTLSVATRASAASGAGNQLELR